jgi:hypothetical protein
MDNKIYSIGQKNAQAKKMRGQKNMCGEKSAVFQSSARDFKNIVHMFLVTDFTGNGIKFHVPLLKSVFFSDGKARILLQT